MKKVLIPLDLWTTLKLEIAWVDHKGTLHIDVPSVIKRLGLPDTPKMRKLVTEELIRIVSATEENPLVIVRDHD